MTGVDIVGGMLRDNAPLVVIVPVERIKGGALDDGVMLPALMLRSVSEIERVKLRRVGRVRITERIEVTVRAGSYREARTVRGRVREICAGRTGSFAGATGVSVINAGAGPELRGPGNSFERSQDFRVSYEIPVSQAGE